MRITAIVLLGSVGCGLDSSSGDPQSSGRVTSPTVGDVLPGDPEHLALHVAGEYDDPAIELRVQSLADPNDLASWRTVATTHADSSNDFAVDVGPFDRTQWPLGGVFRLRVVDADDVPLLADDDQTGVVAVVNPSVPPSNREFLIEKPTGSPEETAAYYVAIDAPLTLTDFQARYGFPTGEVSAVYYNNGDLGIGRDMHCVGNTGAIGGSMACYVRNFGAFGGTKEDAISKLVKGTSPFATVAMVYEAPIESPDAIKFMVYGATGTLVNQAQLDTHGNNVSVPQNCLNCHGGRSSYDGKNHSVSEARFLPFDPNAFVYAGRDDLSFPAQEARFRLLDRMVAGAASPPGVSELIDGLFPRNDGPFNGDFVPDGWGASPRDARVYREAIAPYCRSCHATFQNGSKDPLSFTTAEGTKQSAELIVARICTHGPNGMPAAEQASRAFFASSARALLLAWLGQPGACAP
jgi:hypothetical protein